MLIFEVREVEMARQGKALKKNKKGGRPWKRSKDN
jgi:hypothetical protein